MNVAAVREKAKIVNPSLEQSDDVFEKTNRTIRKHGRLIPEQGGAWFVGGKPFCEVIKDEKVIQNLKEMGYTHATPAQVATITRFYEQNDISDGELLAKFGKSSP